MVSYLLLASFTIIEKLDAVWEMGIEVSVDSAFHTDANLDSTSRVDVDPGTERNVVDMMPTFNLCAGLLEQLMGARNREGIELSTGAPAYISCQNRILGIDCCAP